MPSSVTGIVTNLVYLLPAGTFLAFQAVAPIFTNNGKCGTTEKIMTAVLVVTFSIICFCLRFTDSISTQSGGVYYGVVTSRGLFNPQFLTAKLPYSEGPFYVGPPGTRQFFVGPWDFVNGSLTAVCFCTLALLTPPVTDCFYPGVPGVVTKAVPVIVALVVSFVFALGPPARRGIGFGISNLNTHVLMDTHDGEIEPSSSARIMLPHEPLQTSFIKV